MSIINNINIIIIPAAVCILGLFIARILASHVMKQDKGNDRMTEIHGYIRSGSFAFMIEEVKAILIVLVIIAAILYAIWDVQIAVSFVVGAFCSGLAGFIGMNMATNTNVRNTQAATKGFPEAL